MASRTSSLKPAGAVVGASAGTDASLMKLDIDNEVFTSNVEPGMFTPTERAAADAAAEQRRRAGYDARGRNGGPFTESYPPPGKAFAGYLKGCIGINWVDADDVTPHAHHHHHHHHTGAEGSADGVFGEQPHAQDKASRVVAQPHAQEGGAVVTVVEPHAQSNAARCGHDAECGVDEDGEEDTLGPTTALAWACGGGPAIIPAETNEDALGPTAALAWACGGAGPALVSTRDGPGFCSMCGYSLFHYAGTPCQRTGDMHPLWEGEPPPSYADENP